MIGSVASDVIRQCPVPVMVVRLPDTWSTDCASSDLEDESGDTSKAA